MDKKVKIVVDNREMKNELIDNLIELGAEIENEQLEVGDFLLSDKVAVERKTVADFLQSLIDGRLFEQVTNLTSNFEKPIIIVEGTEDIYEEREIHPNAIRGAIAALAIDFRIPTIQTSGIEETALFLYMIASREQLDKKASVTLRGARKPLTDRFLQEYITTSLPGVGHGIAQNLLKHFKTVKAIFNADEKELQEVEKVGKKKAKRMNEIIEKIYKTE